MNGPLAQMTSLVCYGNAALRGIDAPLFYPENSTCAGCEQIRFVEIGSNIFGRERETIIAAVPDLWLAELRHRGVTGLKLGPVPGTTHGAANFKSTASIGTAGAWSIEAFTKKGVSEFWQSRWKPADTEADALDKIWRVTYNIVQRSRGGGSPPLDTETVRLNFRKALVEIREFAEPHEQCLLFGVCFVKALRALDDVAVGSSYFQDLSPPGVLSEDAACLMNAAMNAWVFGGTDSWNNLKFGRELRPQYETLTHNLFKAINEAIEAAAADGMPGLETAETRQISA